MPTRIQIVRPVPGLPAHLTFALVNPSARMFCNKISEKDLQTIREHPECYRVVHDDEIADAVQRWQDQRPRLEVLR